MKKIVLIIATWFVASEAFSQTTTTTTTTTTEPQTAVAAPAAAPAAEDQKDDLKRVYIGARGLATLSSWRIKNVDNSTVAADFIVGYGAGGVLGVNFSKHVGLQVEVLYSQLAQKYKDNGGITRSLKLNYLNVPLLLVLNTDVRKPVNLNICAGPQVGINTGSSFKTDASNTSDGVDTVHAVLAVKTGDFGLAYGIGVDFLLNPSLKFSLGYRGVQGLIDVSDNSKSTTTDDYYILDRAHVNTYSLYAGLALCF